MSEPDHATVAIIQPFVPTYRVPLFDALAVELGRRGLALEVWHDQPRGRVAARGNAAAGTWSVPIRQRRVSFRGHNLTYRNVRKAARKTALVVAGLASGNVETYGLAVDRKVNLALWGHGRNFTATNHRADQVLESFLIDRSRHVFVYTDAGAQHLVDTGVEKAMVTVVRNSTDTSSITNARATSSRADGDALAGGLTEGDQVGLFVGAFDHSKKLPFLFAAADIIRRSNPRFRLLVAGDGPEAAFVREAVGQRAAWVTLLPRLSAADLGVLSHAVDVILMPGRVGLVAADSLAMGVPIATTRHAFHAPEIEYLDESVASWSDPSTVEFARSVESLLADEGRRASMRSAAADRAADLSAEAAARRFAVGIDLALGAVDAR